MNVKFEIEKVEIKEHSIPIQYLIIKFQNNLYYFDIFNKNNIIYIITIYNPIISELLKDLELNNYIKFDSYSNSLAYKIYKAEPKLLLQLI